MHFQGFINKQFLNVYVRGAHQFITFLKNPASENEIKNN